MVDFKKVIKGFRQCTLPYFADEYETQCHECPYYNPDLSVKDCTDALKNDVMELLKEQHEQIESLKQTAQSMMEGIVVSQPKIVLCNDCKYASDLLFKMNTITHEIDDKTISVYCRKHDCYHEVCWFCADGRT